MKTAWGLSREIVMYWRQILRPLFPFSGTPLYYQGVTGQDSKKLGDNYGQLLYKKNIGRFGSFQFVKRKWLLFFINSPGSARSKPVFDPN